MKYAVAGRAIYHERLVLSETRFENWFIILTPDFDSFAEECSMANEDLDDLVVLRRRGEEPPLLTDATFYQFDGPPSRDARYAARLRTARALARSFVPPGGEERRIRPADVGRPANEGAERLLVADPARNDGGVPAVLLPGTKWLFAENGLEFTTGDEVEAGLMRFIVSVGDHGILNKTPVPVVVVKRVAGEARMELLQEDLRVLPIRYDGQGERRRPFALAVQEMNDEEPDGGMVLVQAPRTAMWTMKDMLTNGGDPRQHHEWWLRAARVPEGDRSAYDMEVLTTVLFCMATIDQLNVPALTSGELLCRRVALIKEAHRISPSAPDYSSSDWVGGLAAAELQSPRTSRSTSWTSCAATQRSRKNRVRRERRRS